MIRRATRWSSVTVDLALMSYTQHKKELQMALHIFEVSVRALHSCQVMPWI